MPPTDNPWLYVIAGIFLFLSGVGGQEMIRGIVRRRPRQAVEITNQINLAKQAQEYAQQLEEDATQARESAQKAWAAVDEAQQKLVRANRRLDDAVWKLEQASRYLDAIYGKVFAHGATIEDVRGFMTTTPPPSTFTSNGMSPD